MRGFQTWSQNWVRIISGHHFDLKKHPKNVEIAILVYFDCFSAKIWVKYYPSSILRPYLESSYQGESFRHPIWKQGWFFGFYVVFSKNNLLCANQKRSCYERKKDIALLFTSHGTGSAPKPGKSLVWWKMKLPNIQFCREHTKQRQDLAGGGDGPILMEWCDTLWPDISCSEYCSSLI